MYLHNTSTQIEYVTHWGPPGDRREVEIHRRTLRKGFKKLRVGLSFADFAEAARQKVENELLLWAESIIMTPMRQLGSSLTSP